MLESRLTAESSKAIENFNAFFSASQKNTEKSSVQNFETISGKIKVLDESWIRAGDAVLERWLHAIEVDLEVINPEGEPPKQDITAVMASDSLSNSSNHSQNPDKSGPLAVAETEGLIPLSQKITSSNPGIQNYLDNIFCCPDGANIKKIAHNLSDHQSCIDKNGTWAGNWWLRIPRKKNEYSGDIDISVQLGKNRRTISKKRESLHACKSELSRLSNQLTETERSIKQISSQLGETQNKLQKSTNEKARIISENNILATQIKDVNEDLQQHIQSRNQAKFLRKACKKLVMKNKVKLKKMKGMHCKEEKFLHL